MQQEGSAHTKEYSRETHSHIPHVVGLTSVVNNFCVQDCDCQRHNCSVPTVNCNTPIPSPNSSCNGYHREGAEGCVLYALHCKWEVKAWARAVQSLGRYSLLGLVWRPPSKIKCGLPLLLHYPPYSRTSCLSGPGRRHPGYPQEAPYVFARMPRIGIGPALGTQLHFSEGAIASGVLNAPEEKGFSRTQGIPAK